MKKRPFCGDKEVWFSNWVIASVLSYGVLTEIYCIFAESVFYFSIFT